MAFWFPSFFSVESFALVFAVVALLRYYIHRKWQFLANMNIPHDPPRLRKLGNVDGLGKAAFMKYNEQKKRHGPIWGMYFFLNPIIVIHDLDIMRQIYTKEFQNFPDRSVAFRKMNGKEMNHGLVQAQDKNWKRIRSTLTPTFSISKLKQMFVLAEQCTAETVSVLEQKSKEENGEFVAKTVFSGLSLDVVVSAALGTKVEVQTSDGKSSRLVKEVQKLFLHGFSSLTAFLCFLFPKSEVVFEKLNIGLFPNDALAYVRDFTSAVIEDRLKTPAERRRTDLLQLMLDAEVPDEEITEDSEKGLKRIEVIGNAMLMIGAGFENTANSMTFLAHSLAFHPEVQTKLQEEIDEAYESKGGFDFDTVKNLKYLDMCMNESLRLYNPLLINSRVCRKETTINGLTIPKGMLVQFPVFGLCHDPELWDDPWEFKPERMEDMSQIDLMAFQPFGCGPRNCIGLRFAEMEMKLAFCHILKRFTLEPCADTPKPPLELEFKMSVRPKKDFKLKVVPRV